MKILNYINDGRYSSTKETVAVRHPTIVNAVAMMARWCFYVNKIEQAAEYSERILSADLSHPGGRKLIEEIKDKIEGSNP